MASSNQLAKSLNDFFSSSLSARDQENISSLIIFVLMNLIQTMVSTIFTKKQKGEMIKSVISHVTRVSAGCLSMRKHHHSNIRIVLT